MQKPLYTYTCACGKKVKRQVKNLFRASCFDCKRARANATYHKMLPNYDSGGGETYREYLDRMAAGRAKREAEREKARKAAYRRHFKFVEMKLAGMSLEDIAKTTEPRITRERVRQILAKITKDEGIVFPRATSKNRTRRVETECTICFNPLLLTERMFKGHGHHRHWECVKQKFTKPDGTIMDRNEKARHRWHTDPKRRVAMKKSYYKWLKKKRKDPEWRKRYNAYQNSYRKKHPDSEEKKARARAKHQARMADPVYREKIRTLWRAAGARRAERKKLTKQI